jgi:hypothetical protein
MLLRSFVQESVKFHFVKPSRSKYRDKDMNLIVIDNRLINKYKFKDDYCETETEFEE